MTTTNAELIAEANAWRSEDPDAPTTEIVSARVSSLVGRLADALESAITVSDEMIRAGADALYWNDCQVMPDDEVRAHDEFIDVFIEGARAVLTAALTEGERR